MVSGGSGNAGTEFAKAVDFLVSFFLVGDEADGAAVEALLNFPRIEGIPGDTVLEWIREGRK